MLFADDFRTISSRVKIVISDEFGAHYIVNILTVFRLPRCTSTWGLEMTDRLMRSYNREIMR